ncbi:hypothetical protein [Amycolatopsis sp. MJM2582]|uniref:hypothetical protein n=1 Tax=Amycolatopsis sp. MJM2582 TaxID=1427749 RepID=UPI0006917465|nr:hypothetical protein [Amycolatopsis sp. MJM2582]
MLDAVFSINARYTSTIAVCDRYAKHQGLLPHLVDVADLATAAGTAAEQPVDALADLGNLLGPARLATDILHNRGRTSARGGVHKAAAAVRYAEILATSDVHTLDDVTLLLADLPILNAVESRLRKVPGNGHHDIRIGYLWMLFGADEQVKPDRKVLRWLRRTLDHEVGVPSARQLLTDAAAAFGCSRWELDNAIWRRGDAAPRSDSARNA